VATTSVVNVDGARVAYRLHGRGPAVLLVNGTAALEAHWGPVIAEFSKHRTVISLDYSGSGDTTDDGSALSLQKLARQVREVARAAGVDRFDLVGHSLGAAIAIHLAASSADLVRSLIAVAGFSWGVAYDSEETPADRPSRNTFKSGQDHVGSFWTSRHSRSDVTVRDRGRPDMEWAMASHKFHVGEIVSLRRPIVVTACMFGFSESWGP
jgi:pimeloyl-ACP methyl ester carboxylesterase